MTTLSRLKNGMSVALSPETLEQLWKLAVNMTTIYFLLAVEYLAQGFGLTCLVSALPPSFNISPILPKR